MRAAFYERYGDAAEVLEVGELPDLMVEPGEVRVAVVASGVNPSDVKARAGARGPIPFERIVPHSDGTGRVGAYAVQLAKQGGATVLATVGSDEKAELARKLGADHALDYRAEGLAEHVLDLTGGRGADRIVDAEFGANLAADTAMLAANGVIATYASTADPKPTVSVYPLMLKNATLRFVLVYDMPEEAKRQAARDVNALLAAGRLQHQIALAVRLDEIAAAHEAIERNTAQGCVIVHPGVT